MERVIDNIDGHLKQHGTDAIVRNFETGATDEYGDSEYVATEIETRIIIRRNSPARQRGDVRLDEAGIDPQLEATFWIDPRVEVYDTEGDTPPSEIEVLGARYQVYLIDDRDWHVRRVFCARK